MKLKDKLKVMLMVPVLIGGSIAVMVISYAFVPLTIVAVATFVAYTIVSSGED